MIIHPEDSDWSVVFIICCSSVSCLKCSQSRRRNSRPVPNSQAHKHPRQSSPAVSRALGEHLTYQGNPALLRNSSLPPEETPFATVIPSVSTDHHYNRAFLLCLLPLTLEDMIVSQGQQSSNSCPHTLGPQEQERCCPEKMVPADGESPRGGAGSCCSARETGLAGSRTWSWFWGWGWGCSAEQEVKAFS